MTREEALKKSISMLSANHREYTEDIHKKFIDEVYDDFESKICDKCKYSEYCSSVDIMVCHNEHTVFSQRCYKCSEDITIFEVTRDFGCNQFEEAENGNRL